jgi:hypothetical protein
MKWRGAILPRLTLSRRSMTFSLRVPGTRISLRWHWRWRHVLARQRMPRAARRPK